MSPLAQFKAFTQSVYLVIKGRYFDDIDGEDGALLLQQTADWANMFIDELETETSPDGEPLDWKWSRQNGFALGTATEGGASIDVPTGINNLLTDENRYVQITVGDAVVSNWAVVAPEQISNKSYRITEDMCSLIGSSIVFSRVFRDYEDGGAITGDVSVPMPRIVLSVSGATVTVLNAKILALIKPKALLTLGVAKNASLPDIVQGGLSPSYAQKYDNLLQNAIARNQAGSIGSLAVRDDFGYVGGV